MTTEREKYLMRVLKLIDERDNLQEELRLAREQIEELEDRLADIQIAEDNKRDWGRE